MLQLHRFMVAVSRVAVNHDGRGFGPGSYCLGPGSRCKQRKVDIRVNVDLATLPPSFLNGPWVQVHGVLILLPGLLVSVCCVIHLFPGFLTLAG